MICIYTYVYIYICMIYDIRYMVYDTWYMIHNIWYMMHDIWYMVYDIWYMINMRVCVYMVYGVHISMYIYIYSYNFIYTCLFTYRYLYRYLICHIHTVSTYQMWVCDLSYLPSNCRMDVFLNFPTHEIPSGRLAVTSPLMKSHCELLKSTFSEWDLPCFQLTSTASREIPVFAAKLPILPAEITDIHLIGV